MKNKPKAVFFSTLKITLSVAAVFDLWLILSSNEDQMVYAKIIILLVALLAISIAVAAAVYVDQQNAQEFVERVSAEIHYPARAEFERKVQQVEATRGRKVNYYV